MSDSGQRDQASDHGDAPGWTEPTAPAGQTGGLPGAPGGNGGPGQQQPGYPPPGYPPPGYPPPGYPPPGYPPPGYPPPGYWQQGPYPPASYGYGPVPAQGTNGLAIASLVCSLFGFIMAIPAIAGVILGFAALSQIRSRGGTQGGRQMAMAGIIIGFVMIALVLFAIAIPTFLGVTCSAGHTCSSG